MKPPGGVWGLPAGVPRRAIICLPPAGLHPVANRIRRTPDPDRVNTGSGGQHGDMGNMMMSCYVMLHDGAVVAWKGC